MKKPIVGITSGDLNGVGIEIIIEIFSNTAMLNHCIPVIFCSSKVINFYKRQLNATSFQYVNIRNFEDLNENQINIFNCWTEDVLLSPGKLTQDGGKYAIRSLEVATQCLKDEDIDVLVTAPIHKANTQSEAFPFVGHTPYFKSFFQSSEILMILFEDDFRVTLMSEHIPIHEVSKNITFKNVLNKLQLSALTMQKDFGINHPKIAVLGLNPHASDEGLIGSEEGEAIVPAIEHFNQNAFARAFGPYSADAFFARNYQSKFDLILAMYHDQGLIPFKSLSTGYGTNYTGGLPFIRTSPDHGVAFDIVGQNKADASSFRRAIFEAIDIYRNRLKFEEN